MTLKKSQTEQKKSQIEQKKSQTERFELLKLIGDNALSCASVFKRYKRLCERWEKVDEAERRG